MDWSTGDYTQTYADTFFLPEPEHGTGIYLLDESGRDSDPGGDPYVRAPIRPYGNRSGRYGKAARHSVPSGLASACRGSRSETGAPLWADGTPDARKPPPVGREGYYTGGNIISSPRGRRPIFDVAWDERPQHYNPRSGEDWAHLVPNPRDRPHGGGWAPSLAFPHITQSEAMVDPYHNPAVGAPSKECFRGASQGIPPLPGQSAEYCLQFIKIILLVVIVVLLAMTLAATGRAARSLEKMIGESVGVLGSMARSSDKGG